MSAWAERTQDMPAVELRGRQQIERCGEQSDPRRAPYRMQQKAARRNTRVQQRREQMQDERRAKDNARVRRIAEPGNEFSVEDPKNKRRHRDDESNERTGSADVKQGASGPNRRTNQNESAQRTDQCGKGNEVRVTGMDVMVATREIMPEFVGKQYGEEREGEGQATRKRQRLAIEQRQRANEFVPRDRLILRVRGGEVRTCH